MDDILFEEDKEGGEEAKEAAKAAAAADRENGCKEWREFEDGLKETD